MSDNNEETFEGTLEEQVEKMRAALERYKTENKKFREQRDEYKAQVDKGVANDETLSKFKARTLRAEAKLRLQSQGIKDTDRLTKYLDFDGVSINDNDEIEGLDEKIESLKGDFPELFDPKRRVGGQIDSAERPEPTGAKSATELQAARLLRK